MTISLQANAAGTAGQINIGATPVVNIPVASGLPFCKNKLFNGEVTRINQRAFDGNWTAKNMWDSGLSQSGRELTYGYDMWAKASSTDMVQHIEAGNFRPSTVHTLSGTGVTTQQITSPASGNWAITVPQAARNVQVEEGAVATPFEIRPISFELAQCQRYYEEKINLVLAGYHVAPSQLGNTNTHATKRVIPSLNLLAVRNVNNVTDLVFGVEALSNFYAAVTLVVTGGGSVTYDIAISAVI